MNQWKSRVPAKFEEPVEFKKRKEGLLNRILRVIFYFHLRGQWWHFW